MIISSNEKCPVCNNNFEQEDDIVVCPKCGTPHHRACYNSLGHCANADKHSSGFEYSGPAVSDNNAHSSAPDAVSPEQENSQKDNQNYYNPQNSKYYNNRSGESGADNKTVCPQCNSEINKDAPFCSHCGARQQNAQYREYSPINDFGFNNAAQQYENDTRTVDGKNIADIAAVVRTNVNRFIPKFLQNKKLSWNWGAFFFGPYYLFYRKMYKQGALFLSVNVIVQFFLNGFYAKEISDFMSFFNANYQALYNNPSAELLNEMTELSNSVMPMMYILIGATLLISIIIALFADSFYKTRVIQVLDKVDENLQQGASFNMISPMLGDTPLSQADMKKLYLGKMGGTSILSPIAAWCALDIITWLVSLLIS